jgi:trk system potassium uptake protein TrkH
MRNPAVSLMLSFLITILLGTFLLMHPESSASGEITPFIDALFTSTSATCVTGLIVYDTGSYFSQVGQIIILMLIQVGGLGVMTISTAFAIILGQNLTISTQKVMQNVVGESNRLNFYSLLKSILSFTFVFEVIGAAILFLQFKDHLPTVSDAIYHSIFHSVSAFCNAGFALYSDSFVSYQNNSPVVLTIGFLIIFGGLGFAVMNDIRFNFLKKFAFGRLTLHSKIVLITTAVLIILGTGVFFLSEFRNTMADFRFGDRLLNSWFQSVTCRTAGFNTIDEARLTNGSSLASIVLMFIGASPGSTGGGIKTTTIALLIIAMISSLRGANDINAFKRRISLKSIKEVVALLAIALLVLGILTFFFMVTENQPFRELLFESVSAFATVGLSMGITPHLSVLGKIIIIILMYLGRIGPMTLIYATSLHMLKVRVRYNEENVSIG